MGGKISMTDEEIKSLYKVIDEPHMRYMCPTCAKKVAKAQLTKAKPLIALNTVRLINEYADGEISFERMAELMGVNFYDLHSIFKQVVK